MVPQQLLKPESWFTVMFCESPGPRSCIRDSTSFPGDCSPSDTLAPIGGPAPPSALALPPLLGALISPKFTQPVQGDAGHYQSSQLGVSRPSCRRKWLRGLASVIQWSTHRGLIELVNPWRQSRPSYTVCSMHRFFKVNFQRETGDGG